MNFYLIVRNPYYICCVIAIYDHLNINFKNLKHEQISFLSRRLSCMR